MLRDPAQVARDLFDSNRVVTLGSAQYLYSGSEHVGWVNLDSSLSDQLISSMFGSGASVNTHSSSAPVKAIIRVTPTQAVHLPFDGSVNISGRRYALTDITDTYEGDTDGAPVLKLEPAVVLNDPDKAKASVAIKSLPNDCITDVTTHGCYSAPVMSRITDVLGPDSAALLWHMGNCLIDDKRVSHIVAICGPSNTGKSTMMRAVSEVMQGVATNVAGYVLTNYSSITPSVVSSLANSRIALASDIDHSGNGYDLNSIKAITGGDPVVGMHSSSVVMNATTLYTTNSVPIPSPRGGFTKPEHAKRLHCLNTVRPFGTAGIRVPSLTMEERAQIAMAAIYTKWCYACPYGSLRSLICSLCLGVERTISPYMWETEEVDYESECESLDCLRATLGVDMDCLIQCIGNIFPSFLRPPCEENTFKYGLRACRVKPGHTFPPAEIVSDQMRLGWNMYGTGTGTPRRNGTRREGSGSIRWGAVGSTGSSESRSATPNRL